MLKKMLLAGMMTILAAIIVVTPVLGAAYTQTITVTNNSASSYLNYPVMTPQANDYMATNGYISSTGLDVKIKDTGGTALPTMLTDKQTWFVPSSTINPYASFQYNWTSGNVSTVTNLTGHATGSPITLVAGDNTVTVTQLGTFTVVLGSGGGIVTSGTTTVTDSPVKLNVGTNTITTTGATGTFSVFLFMPIIVGDGGYVTTPDNANLETYYGFGSTDPYEIDVKGMVDTTASQTFISKVGAISVTQSAGTLTADLTYSMDNWVWDSVSDGTYVYVMNNEYYIWGAPFIYKQRISDGEIVDYLVPSNSGDLVEAMYGEEMIQVGSYIYVLLSNNAGILEGSQGGALTPVSQLWKIAKSTMTMSAYLTLDANYVPYRWSMVYDGSTYIYIATDYDGYAGTSRLMRVNPTTMAAPTNYDITGNDDLANPHTITKLISIGYGNSKVYIVGQYDEGGWVDALAVFNAGVFTINRFGDPPGFNANSLNSLYLQFFLLDRHIAIDSTYLYHIFSSYNNTGVIERYTIATPPTYVDSLDLSADSHKVLPSSMLLNGGYLYVGMYALFSTLNPKPRLDKVDTTTFTLSTQTTAGAADRFDYWNIGLDPTGNDIVITSRTQGYAAPYQLTTWIAKATMVEGGHLDHVETVPLALPSLSCAVTSGDHEIRIAQVVDVPDSSDYTIGLYVDGVLEDSIVQDSDITQQVVSFWDTSSDWIWLDGVSYCDYIKIYIDGNLMLQYQPITMPINDVVADTGTATFTTSSTTVTGAGTSWTNHMIGGQIKSDVDGVYYPIANVTSATTLTLTTAYNETGGSTAFTLNYYPTATLPDLMATEDGVITFGDFLLGVVGSFSPALYSYGNLHTTPLDMAKIPYNPGGNITNYSDGLATFVNGSNVVTGNGTSWLSTMKGGQIKLDADGTYYEIASVTSATNMTLTANYTQAGGSGAYHMTYLSSGVVSEDTLQTNNLLTPWFSPWANLSNIPVIVFFLFVGTAALEGGMVWILKSTQNQFVALLLLLVGEAFLYKMGIYELWFVIATGIIGLAILVFERKPAL